MYFGAHVKSSGGVWHAIENGVAIGAEAVQFFAGSPRTWAPTVYKEKDAAQFREARAASPIRFVLIHTIYLINLASEKEDFYEKSVTSLFGALAAADQLGADAIVTHIGSHQGAGFAAGLERVQAGLRRALAASEGSPVRLLLENTAGAGGTMGVDFLELGQIIDAAGGDPRLGVCLDTAHIFESGVDLRTREGMAEALERVDAGCGRERLVACTSTTPRRRSDPTATVTRTSARATWAWTASARSSTSRRSPSCPASSRCLGSTVRVRIRRTSPGCGSSSRLAASDGPPEGAVDRGYTRAAPNAGADPDWPPKAGQLAVYRRCTDYCEVTRWNS